MSQYYHCQHPSCNWGFCVSLGGKRYDVGVPDCPSNEDVEEDACIGGIYRYGSRACKDWLEACRIAELTAGETEKETIREFIEFLEHVVEHGGCELF